MKLICEHSQKISALVENAENNAKKYYVEGVFAQAVVKNRNGRMYPKSVLDEAVSEYDKNFIQKKKAYGELDHPACNEVQMKNVCIITERLTENKNDYVGKARILTKTPYGQIVQALIDENVQLSVSTRGLGSIKETAKGEEVTNYILNAIDIVSDPSAPSAFVKGVLESKEFIVNKKGKIVDALNIKYKDFLTETSSKKLKSTVEQIIFGKLEEIITNKLNNL